MSEDSGCKDTITLEAQCTLPDGHKGDHDYETPREIYEWHVRGLGMDNSPGCFVCGGDDHMYSNFAAFVRSKGIGERIVELFVHGARLDFRDFEPNWIQVKIGACAEHVPNLKILAAYDRISHVRVLVAMQGIATEE